MEPVPGERNRVLQLEYGGKQRVGERAGGGDHHRSVTQLGLVVKDLLKLVGGQLWPVPLRDHDRPLDHDGGIKRSRGGTVDAERQKSITLLRRIIADADVLVECPSMPGNDVRHRISSIHVDSDQKQRSPASAKARRLESGNRQLPLALVKAFLTRRV